MRAERVRTIHRRRRAALAAGLVAAASFIVGAAAGSGGGDPEDSSAATAEAVAELPRGGTELLPAQRLVGFYGAPQDPGLGALGIGAPERAARRLERQAAEYEGERPIRPFFELLATVANADPGEDGAYRTRQPPGVIDEYLAAARAARAYLVLDVQPGRSSFAEEIAPLEPYLAEPDVGLALDPEWHVGPDEVPGEVIGSVDARVVNAVASRLSEIVEENDLPQKLLIVHRFTPEMVANPERLRSHPGVALVLNVDGFGYPADKIVKYEELRAPRGSGLFSGFKLFYSEDLGLMSPKDVLALRPEPDVVIYE